MGAKPYGSGVGPETLRDVARKLGHLDIEEDDDLAERTLYAERPWTPDSRVVVLEGQGVSPTEHPGFDYLLEVDLAVEVLEVWSERQSGRLPTPDEAALAIIHYAQNDAFQPAVRATEQAPQGRARSARERALPAKSRTPRIVFTSLLCIVFSQASMRNLHEDQTRGALGMGLAFLIAAAVLGADIIAVVTRRQQTKTDPSAAADGGTQLPAGETAWRRIAAETSSGDVWEDPSEDLLFELCGDVERGDEEWFVVDAVDREQEYIQMRRSRDGRFLLERRSGTSSSHQHAVTDSIRAAHAELTAWAFGSPPTDSNSSVVWQSGTG